MPADEGLDVFRVPPPGSRRGPWRTLRRGADVQGLVALGGGLGSLARYGLDQRWPATESGFPVATFTVNIVGSVLIGLLMVFVAEIWTSTRYARPLLGIGLLGGFTTYSALMTQTRALAADGTWLLAFLYPLASVVAGVAAAGLGMMTTRKLAGLPVRRLRADPDLPPEEAT